LRWGKAEKKKNLGDPIRKIGLAGLGRKNMTQRRNGSREKSRRKTKLVRKGIEKSIDLSGNKGR